MMTCKMYHSFMGFNFNALVVPHLLNKIELILGIYAC